MCDTLSCSHSINCLIIYIRGSQIFQHSRSHVEILGVGRMTRISFNSEDPQISGCTVQSLVAWANWRPGFVHPWFRSFLTGCCMQYHEKQETPLQVAECYPNAYLCPSIGNLSCFQRTSNTWRWRSFLKRFGLKSANFLVHPDLRFTAFLHSTRNFQVQSVSQQTDKQNNKMCIALQMSSLLLVQKHWT
jgi:hypothetical protein